MRGSAGEALSLMPSAGGGWGPAIRGRGRRSGTCGMRAAEV